VEDVTGTVSFGGGFGVADAEPDAKAVEAVKAVVAEAQPEPELTPEQAAKKKEDDELAAAVALVSKHREKLMQVEQTAAEEKARNAIKLREPNASQASTDARVNIIIDETSDPNAVIDVQIGCNGRTYVMQRGKVVSVPPEVVEGLENAVGERAIPNIDERGNEAGVIFKPNRRFPFSIVDVESMEIMKAWRRAVKEAANPAAA